MQILKAGKPIGQFFSFLYAGKNDNGVSQFVAADGSLTTTPIVGKDYHYMGSSQPKLLMGWNNSFKYSNFDLNIFIRGAFGNKIFNATRADLFRPNTAQYTNILKDAADESVKDINAYAYSLRFIESGSYVWFDKSYIKILSSVLLVGVLAACHDLEVPVTTELTTDVFPTTTE